METFEIASHNECDQVPGALLILAYVEASHNEAPISRESSSRY